MISSTNADDADIQREITNMFVRTNILLRRFSLCSNNVKTVLFKTYCLCRYDAALWKTYNLGTLGKLRSCYHRCVKYSLDIEDKHSADARTTQFTLYLLMLQFRLRSSGLIAVIELFVR